MEHNPAMDENYSGKRIFTVTELTRNIKARIETSPELNNVWIKGEISNLTVHSSGHIYFSLKDENALIDAVFFKYANKNLSFRLEEGMSVLAFGSVTVFEKRGRYQINVLSVRLEGIGELLKKIEQLKKKLLAEGIFDQLEKRPLPFLPRRLGVVTSPTGAAIRDIMKVALRRYPNLEIILAPAKVQGEDAAVSIVRAIEVLNDPSWNIDVIIAGRGGGSFEDLMPFNEEIVVRAFYKSRVPIISAVGHQIDHPLSDDSADFAAPTPSAAAEMAIPVKSDLTGEIEYYMSRISGALYSYHREMKIRLAGLRNLKIFRDPRALFDNRYLRVADSENRIISGMKEAVASGRNRLYTVPDIKALMKSHISSLSYRFGIALQAVEKMSPIAVLQRGYSIVRDLGGNTVKSVNRVKEGEDISVQLLDGKLGCEIVTIEKAVLHGKG